MCDSTTAPLRDEIGLPFAPVERAIEAVAAQHNFRVTKPAGDLINALLSEFILQLCHQGSVSASKKRVVNEVHVRTALETLYAARL
ncbi:Histone-like transcription factor [Nannochloropsis gaditana]|uniref:Histone-like transcription factor n=1 Tax=Nannochloropsis gaditana TaxID=72520 RepID=W7TUV9_9STRA|nr:Histone-like transcription factor [Nannochloropsis gaditana]